MSRAAISLARPLAVLALAGCSAFSRGSTGGSAGGAPSARQLPQTRAERTRYRETSRHEDVIAFLDSLQTLGAPMWVGSIGRSVEGKEALQALVRDLAFAPSPKVLDSVVVLVVPIYDADGNERVGPQARNRNEQNGPELVGMRIPVYEWRRARRTLPAGSFIVPTSQPLGVLAASLLEPESDDGLATWNVLDPRLARGGEFPVLRVAEPLRAARRPEP